MAVTPIELRRLAVGNDPTLPSAYRDFVVVARDLALDLTPDPAVDLAHDLELASQHDLAARDLAPDRTDSLTARHLAHSLADALADALALTRNVRLAPDPAHNLDSTLAHLGGLARGLDVGRDGTLFLDLTLDSVTDLARSLADALAREDLTAIATADTLAGWTDDLLDAAGTPPPELAMWAMTATVIFVLAMATYDVDQRFESTETSGVLPLDPAADAAVSFDRMWGLVERARSTKRLSRSDDEEIRVLNHMRQLAANLDRHPDLYDEIVSRLEGLLPAVYKAITPPGTPIPTTLELANNQAADDEATLTALADDMRTAADNLDAANEAIDEEPDHPTNAASPDDEEESAQPIFPGLVGQLHQLFRRIDATREKLAQTKTGRAVLRGAASAATTGAAAVANPTAALLTGSISAIYTAFGDWIYTEIRRRRPSLPPRNSRDS